MVRMVKIVSKFLMAAGFVGLVSSVSCSDEQEATQEPLASDDAAGSMGGVGGMPAAPTGTPSATGSQAVAGSQVPGGKAVAGSVPGVGSAEAPKGMAGAAAALQGATQKAVQAEAVAQQQASAVNADSKRFVTASHLNVRSGPGMKFSAVGVLTKNTEVQVKETVSNGRWIKIDEGKFVAGKFLSKAKN